jgi:hypothetical protein
MKTEVKNFGELLEECYQAQKLCAMLLEDMRQCGLTEIFTLKYKDEFGGNDIGDIADLMCESRVNMIKLIESYEASTNKIEMLPPPPIQDLQDFLDSI